jgi:hypothetical protein
MAESLVFGVDPVDGDRRIFASGESRPELGLRNAGTYVGPWPTSFGVWKGDISRGVGAENGVTPIGTGMLKFENTRWGVSYPNGATGDLVQFIDLSPFAVEVAGGEVKVRYSALFNRVADDGAGTVDTQFSVRLYARAGSLATFFNDSSPKLAFGEATILADNDVETWEEAAGLLSIPTETTHLVLAVRAVENVMNEVADEFAGHYADEVVVAIVPEPATWTLVTVGAAFLRRRRGSSPARLIARTAWSL